MSQLIETNDLGIAQSASEPGGGAGQRADEEHKMADATGHKAHEPSGGATHDSQSSGDCFAMVEFTSGQTLQVKQRHGLCMAIKKRS